jgi:Spy/CpxP family protein refolding chaperone
VNRLSVILLASGILFGLSGPALAFQCPSDIAQIDAALEGADLTDEQKQQVMELRDEGERLHDEGSHQEAVDTLAQAKAILGIE